MVDTQTYNSPLRQFTASTAKEVIALGVDNWREVFEQIQADEDDFWVDDYRFIADDVIDGVLRYELLSDEYILGCFSGWFIADITGLPMDTVEKLQANDGFEGLGALMAQHIDEVVGKYVQYDGYGHHFNSWDGGEEEITINGTLYHVFRN